MSISYFKKKSNMEEVILPVVTVLVCIPSSHFLDLHSVSKFSVKKKKDGAFFQYGEKSWQNSAMYHSPYQGQTPGAFLSYSWGNWGLKNLVKISLAVSCKTQFGILTEWVQSPCVPFPLLPAARSCGGKDKNNWLAGKRLPQKGPLSMCSQKSLS